MKKTVLICLIAVCAALILCLTACGTDDPEAGSDRVTDIPEDTTAEQTADTSPGSGTDSGTGSGADGTAADEPVQTDAKLPEFSLPGGIVGENTVLTLTLPEGAPKGSVITYTTDCREPTADGKKTSGGIKLLTDGDCTVIRAAIFTSDGDMWGGIATGVYMRSGTTDMRIVSLVADPDDLYGAKSGILTNRSGTGREWERPCYVMVTEPDGSVPVSRYAGLRLAGAGSRSFDPASFRVTARKSASLDENPEKYAGGGSFKANLFENCDITSYDGFLLRNGGNDAISQARSDFLRQTIARDAIANNVCGVLTDSVGWQVFAQRAEPVVVYLNGEYYGVLNMKQDFNEDLLRRAYGIDDKYVSIVKGKKNGKQMWYKSESGTEQDISDWQALCAYATEHALASDYAEAYEYLASRLDIDNAAQYLAVMTYLCNTDWPQNNVMVWRYTGESGEKLYTDGKWRFVIRDMDLCFALHDKASQTSSTTYSMADTDTFERILTFYWDGKGYRYDESTGLYGDEMGIQGLYDFLLRSAGFRRKLRDCAEYLTSDAFASACKAETERYFSLLKPEMKKFIGKWQTYGSVSTQLTASRWEDGKKDILTFIKDRPENYLKYLNNALRHYE